MRVPGERYSFREVAQTLKGEKIGPDTLIRCLKNGDLVACVQFPRYLEEWTDLKTEYWEKYERDVTPGIAKLFSDLIEETEPDEFVINCDFLILKERKRLRKLAIATARRDLGLIGKRYKSMLEAQGIPR